ncbi:MULTISPECIES: hypothetical protein [Bacillus]|uniref:hypothetical protein n=1 Tax=Bacillus TaxID=1386 RepID=UPI00119E4285|nr:hypothetical protein [Bacillus altitudinis]MBS4747427.1 hypothetical protein [Bacillus altitudinis]MBS4749424.1 hypothetical protein [Bacillus altitudinis]
MPWFKKKNKVSCSHKYCLVDFGYKFTASLDIEDIYEIKCDYCSYSRNVDDYTFNKLKELNLVEV